jgi:hypothetical protein
VLSVGGAAIAVAGRSVALLRRGIGQVRRVDGSLVSSFQTSGIPGQVALGSGLVAVFWRAIDGGDSISLFDASTGSLRRTVSVASGSFLARGVISGHRVVFATGLRIRALDTPFVRDLGPRARGRLPVRPLRVGRPRRLVENLSGYARIRALTRSG